MKTFNTVIEARYYSRFNPSETVERKSYDRHGNLKYHCFYVNGKTHGECKSYHNNGQLWDHCFFVNDKQYGEYKSYLSNGQLHTHCFFVNDEEIKLDHLNDGSYKSLCIKNTLFNGNVFDEDI